MNNDPFAKLGAIDQKLFQIPPQKEVLHAKNPETPKVRNPEIPAAVKPVLPKVGKPESLKTRIPANSRVEKYTTQLEPDLIKQIKQYALEYDIKDYEVVQQAVKVYLAKK